MVLHNILHINDCRFCIPDFYCVAKLLYPAVHSSCTKKKKDKFICRSVTAIFAFSHLPPIRKSGNSLVVVILCHSVMIAWQLSAVFHWPLEVLEPWAALVYITLCVFFSKCMFTVFFFFFLSSSSVWRDQRGDGRHHPQPWFPGKLP